MNFNTPRVQRWLERLDLSWFGRHLLTDFIVRVFIHITGIPHRWICLLKILWLAKKFDLIYFQAVLPPPWYMRLLANRNHRIVFDYDDALYVRYEKRTRVIIQSSWKVIAGSHVLMEYAKQYSSDVIFIQGSVPINKYSLRENNPEGSPLRIGWIGGVSTLKQLKILDEPLKRLAQKGYHFEFIIAGSKKLASPLAHCKDIPIIDIPNYTDDEIPALVKKFDIGVMPLFDTPIEQGKCAFKTIIYMAGQLPIVCSPVGEAKFIVQEGMNGFFAATTEEWVVKLEELLKDDKLRERLGKAGRKLVEEKYTEELTFQILNLEIIQPVLAEKNNPVTNF